jgi:hypothetical protein
VFENRVRGRVSAPKRSEDAGDWRKLHNEDLHNLYSSPDVIKIIKSEIVRWAWHAGRIGR